MNENTSFSYGDLDALITNKLINNELLFNHVYWVQQKIDLKPDKEHILSSIEYTDILPRKDDFITELVNTAISWVYSQKKQESLLKERYEKTQDYGNASTFLFQQARKKFRKGKPQGQFGELLLFNFLQRFFTAVPLVRKIPITTSPNVERFGADAIHIAKEGNNILFYLGEAKCYKSNYHFSNALKAAILSILNSFDKFFKELDLYTYDDFLDVDLKMIAQNLKENKLRNIDFELVCILIYNEATELQGEDEQTIKANIVKSIETHCDKFDKSFFDKFPQAKINRIHYIFFPVWGLDSLLDDFVEQL